MPRSRNIKPSFFFNEELSELKPLVRLLFIGLWTIADREGRLEDKPKKIKVQVLPYDRVDIDKALTELQNLDFILRYSALGHSYIQIINFKKHQHPHCKESASEIPAPVKPGTSTVQVSEEHGASTSDSLNPLTDSLNPLIDCERGSDTLTITDDELQKLFREYGEEIVIDYIERLKLHIESTGKEYKNHAATLRKWMLNDGLQRIIA